MDGASVSYENTEDGIVTTTEAVYTEEQAKQKVIDEFYPKWELQSENYAEMAKILLPFIEEHLNVTIQVAVTNEVNAQLDTFLTSVKDYIESLEGVLSSWIPIPLDGGTALKTLLLLRANKTLETTEETTITSTAVVDTPQVNFNP